MKRFLKLLFCLISVIFVYSGCQKMSSDDNLDEDRMIHAIYEYDNGKQIILYENPSTASVNGKSGNWTFCDNEHQNFDGCNFYDASEPYYLLRFGNDECTIWIKSGMIFWGSEKEALANACDKSNWTLCHKKL